MKHIKYKVDGEGIAFVTWDVMNSPVNIMNENTMPEFFTAIKQAIHDEKVKGLLSIPPKTIL